MKATEDLEFLELERRIREAGLFERNGGFYILQVAILLLLCAISCWLLITSESFLLQIVASATALASADTLTSYLMHDTAHGAVLDPEWHPRWHTLARRGLGFFLGTSVDGWQKKHTEHHWYPNDPILDPDVRNFFVKFTSEQAEAVTGFRRLIAQYQHLLFPFLLLFLAIHTRIVAISYARTKRARIDLLLIALHVVVYLGLLSLGVWLSVLSLPRALAFIALHNGLFGFCLGVAFSVNHIGMPMGVQEDGYVPLQMTSARNISGGWLVSFLMGALNIQGPHHLFSAMSHSNLQKAVGIVKQFCKEREITYYEVSFWRALLEVYLYLRSIAMHARKTTSPVLSKTSS